MLYKQMPKKGNREPHSSLSQLTCQEILGVLDTREFDQTLRMWESGLRDYIARAEMLIANDSGLDVSNVIS